MNCSECKNLIRELLDPERVLNSAEAVAHLHGCRDCQNFMRYEKALLKSFSSIAHEPPPPVLAQPIMAIQSKHISQEKAQSQNRLTTYLRNLLTMPFFKVAITAGLTGFFAAVVLMRTIYAPVPPANQTSQTILLDKTEVATATAPVISVTSAKTEQKNLLLSKPADDLTVAAMAPADSLVNEKEVSHAGDLIPGAVTFSLAEEAYAAETATGLIESALSEPAPQLAMAMQKRKAMSPSMRMATKPMETSAINMQMNESESRGRTEIAEEFAAAPPAMKAAEPLSLEIAELLEKHDLNLPDGFINIDDLAMRGFLGTAQLKKLKPPAGNGWYLQTIRGKKSISLKKR